MVRWEECSLTERIAEELSFELILSSLPLSMNLLTFRLKSESIQASIEEAQAKGGWK